MLLASVLVIVPAAAAFCEDEPGHAWCAPERGEVVEMTPERRAFLRRLTFRARYQPDGRDEWRARWRGDCEDIALMWRRQAEKRDPQLAAAMRPALVRTLSIQARFAFKQPGMRHVVMTIATTDGLLVIDPLGGERPDADEPMWIATEGVGKKWTMR